MAQAYTRDSDGTAFVCSAHREVFEHASVSYVKKELREMSSIQGSNAVISVTPLKHIAVVTSDLAGYSLGECVLFHFLQEGVDQSANIVWCEEVDEVEEICLLVIIVRGVVEYDAVITSSSLDTDALLILRDTPLAFDIYSHGQTPVSDPHQTLDGNLIAQTHLLPNPILPILGIDERFEFCKITSAFHRAQLVRRWTWILILAATMTLSVGLYQFLYVSSAPLSQPVYIDNYEDFKRFLHTPDPSELVTKTYQHIDSIKKEPGIRVLSSAVTNGVLTVKMELVTDVTSSLRPKLIGVGWKVAIGSGDLVAVRNLNINNRPEVTTIIDHAAVLNTLVDNAMAAGFTVSLSQGRSSGHYKQSKIQLRYTAVRNLQHDYLALMIKDHPVVLNQITIKQMSLHQQKTTVTLTIYGQG